jgi:hypothetical protein
VLVQVLRKAVVRRADEHVAIAGMTPSMELLHVIRKYKDEIGCEKGKKEWNRI